ncbi:hypothetical protein [Psychromicrobium xiongbiense]|uniref:hypothetical protein n=1 Tax=Psychromicrobium xiongbiense TaxID=3051184 RepID=UPI002555581A|nr:hypothetical protein [Psychromicrobium sp. YIM S02556]
MWSILLMGLGGLLVGGVIAFWQQKAPRWVPVCFGILAVLAFIAAYLFTSSS